MYETFFGPTKTSDPREWQALYKSFKIKYPSKDSKEKIKLYIDRETFLDMLDRMAMCLYPENNEREFVFHHNTTQALYSLNIAVNETDKALRRESLERKIERISIK